MTATFAAQLNLQGRLVVVVGDGSAVADAVETLRPSGCRFLIVSPRVDASGRASVAADGPAWRRRSLRGSDCRRAALVIVAGAGPLVLARAERLARRHGVPLHAIEPATATSTARAPSSPRRDEPLVALVGAGPGDPRLITRRGAELLARADVVLYDRLCSPELLADASPRALLVSVGKSKGAGTTQAEIERLLVEHALRGRRVVRLKGGDPFLFGRGSEEHAALAEHGIDVEVVPGVSSALAAPLYAGIAVTERGVSASCTIVSGHRLDDDYDWDAMAALGGTLVVLMAASTASVIADRLLGAGLPSDEPVAIVASASLPSQRVEHTDLAGLARRGAPIDSPAVLVIGAVAGRRSVAAQGSGLLRQVGSL